MILKVKLVCKDWTQYGNPLPRQQYILLSSHDFHAGSTFDGTIELDDKQVREIACAFEKGFTPVFELHYVGQPFSTWSKKEIITSKRSR